MRHVIFVAKKQLECVRSQRQRDLRLGLTRPKVQVIEIIRNRLPQRRQRGIDHQMVVPGIGFLHAGRRHTHVDETEADHRRTRNVAAVGWVYEIDLRVRGRGMPAGSSRGRSRTSLHDTDPEGFGHQRRGMRNVSLISQEKPQGVLSGRQAHLSFGLAGAKMQVIEIVWNWLIQWGQFGIDQQMVVSGIFSIGTCWRHPHPAQPKMNGGSGRKRVAILQVDEINRRPCGGRRRPTVGLAKSGFRHCNTDQKRSRA